MTKSLENDVEDDDDDHRFEDYDDDHHFEDDDDDHHFDDHDPSHDHGEKKHCQVNLTKNTGRMMKIISLTVFGIKLSISLTVASKSLIPCQSS